MLARIRTLAQALFIFIPLFLLAISIISPDPASYGKKVKGVSDSQEISAEEYKAISSIYTNKVYEKGPDTALKALEENITRDDILSRYCHPIAHEIGRAAYGKYGDLKVSLGFFDELCNSGFIHGVLEAYMSAQGDSTDFSSVCKTYPDDSYEGWECNHGIGHGFMYITQNDLPSSISQCETLTSDFDVMSCVNGVFMENFNTDQKTHLSEFLDAHDPFSPCQEQDEKYRADCYLYAPTYFLSLNDDNYKAALAWCMTAPNKYREACAIGVGYKVMKDNLNNPSFVEGVCATNTSLSEPCIKGAVGLYLLHKGSKDEASMLCSKLTGKNTSTCRSEVSNFRW